MRAAVLLPSLRRRRADLPGRDRAGAAGGRRARAWRRRARCGRAWRRPVGGVPCCCSACSRWRRRSGCVIYSAGRDRDLRSAQPHGVDPGGLPGGRLAARAAPGAGRAGGRRAGRRGDADRAGDRPRASGGGPTSRRAASFIDARAGAATRYVEVQLFFSDAPELRQGLRLHFDRRHPAARGAKLPARAGSRRARSPTATRLAGGRRRAGACSSSAGAAERARAAPSRRRPGGAGAPRGRAALRRDRPDRVGSGARASPPSPPACASRRRSATVTSRPRLVSRVFARHGLAVEQDLLDRRAARAACGRSRASRSARRPARASCSVLPDREAATAAAPACRGGSRSPRSRCLSPGTCGTTSSAAAARVGAHAQLLVHDGPRGAVVAPRLQHHRALGELACRSSPAGE